MMMLNDMSDVDDGLSSPAVIKAVNSVSSRDIFQLIVQVCLENKFLRLEVAKELLTTASPSSDKEGAQKAEPADDINALLDTSMLDFGGDLTFDTSPSNENENEHVLIKQVSNLCSVVDLALPRYCKQGTNAIFFTIRTWSSVSNP
jgi:hypothetical protein